MNRNILFCTALFIFIPFSAKPTQKNHSFSKISIAKIINKYNAPFCLSTWIGLIYLSNKESLLKQNSFLIASYIYLSAYLAASYIINESNKKKFLTFQKKCLSYQNISEIFGQSVYIYGYGLAFLNEHVAKIKNKEAPINNYEALPETTIQATLSMAEEFPELYSYTKNLFELSLESQNFIATNPSLKSIEQFIAKINTSAQDFSDCQQKYLNIIQDELQLIYKGIYSKLKIEDL